MQDIGDNHKGGIGKSRSRPILVSDSKMFFGPLLQMWYSAESRQKRAEANSLDSMTHGLGRLCPFLRLESLIKWRSRHLMDKAGECPLAHTDQYFQNLCLCE